MKKYSTFILFSLVFALVGCKEPTGPLKPKTLRLVDTLVAHKWKILEPEQDSLCESTFDRIYTQAYDSMMTLRLLEKNELIQYEIK